MFRIEQLFIIRRQLLHMLHIDIDIFVNYNWVDTRWQ